MSFEFWFVYVTTVFVASIVPGPSMLLALSHGTRFGARRTVASALGNTTASLIQAMIAMAGLGAILSASGAVFLTIKWGGAAYLIYIGLKTWLAPSPDFQTTTAEAKQVQMSSRQMFRQAFLVAAGNPKAIVFFTALFPQFIDPEIPPLTQFTVLLSTLGVIAFAAMMIYAFGGYQLASFLTRAQARKYFNRLIGGTFVGVGISLAASEQG
jgi:threonine/homoserine/homoserine lactone efflux protein